MCSSLQKLRSPLPSPSSSGNMNKIHQQNQSPFKTPSSSPSTFLLLASPSPSATKNLEQPQKLTTKISKIQGKNTFWGLYSNNSSNFATYLMKIWQIQKQILKLFLRINSKHLFGPFVTARWTTTGTTAAGGRAARFAIGLISSDGDSSSPVGLVLLDYVHLCSRSNLFWIVSVFWLIFLRRFLHRYR